MTIYIRVNPEFDDLPLLQSAPAEMSDADVAFHSDLTYLRDLLTDLGDQAHQLGRARDIPPPWSDQLDAAIHEVKLLDKRIRECDRG